MMNNWFSGAAIRRPTSLSAPWHLCVSLTTPARPPARLPARPPARRSRGLVIPLHPSVEVPAAAHTHIDVLKPFYLPRNY